MFEKATEEVRWVYTAVVVKTNCTNKINGHRFEWLFGEDAERVRSQYPQLKLAIVRCIYCGKIKETM